MLVVPRFAATNIRFRGGGVDRDIVVVAAAVSTRPHIDSLVLVLTPKSLR